MAAREPSKPTGDSQSEVLAKQNGSFWRKKGIRTHHDSEKQPAMLGPNLHPPGRRTTAFGQSFRDRLQGKPEWNSGPAWRRALKGQFPKREMTVPGDFRHVKK